MNMSQKLAHGRFACWISQVTGTQTQEDINECQALSEGADDAEGSVHLHRETKKM